MAKRLRLFDKQGNPVVFDIGAASVTIDAEGKSLDVKLSELVAAIASSVKSVTFNGNTPTIDAYGNVNLGKQMNPDWNESNPNWPSFIANKPSVPSRTSQLQNDSGFITEEDLPEGVECDTQMSSTSVKPVQNKVIKAYVDNLINGLIDGAPAALDTLKELATALGNNSDAYATLINLISSKANASEVAGKLSQSDISVETQGDGTVKINVGSGANKDTYSINLNHTHENMAKLVVCEESDLPSTLDNSTIYAITDSGETEIEKLIIKGMEFAGGGVPDTGEPMISSPSNGSTINLGTNDGSGVSKTITVKGKNLTGDLTVTVGTGLTISYGQSTGQSSVTIPMAQALLGAQVSVSYGGSGALDDGSLVISHGGSVLSSVVVVVVEPQPIAVKFTGSQWVETGVDIGPNTAMKLDMRILNDYGSQRDHYHIFSVSNSGFALNAGTVDEATFLFFWIQGVKIEHDYGSGLFTRGVVDYTNGSVSFLGQTFTAATKTSVSTNLAIGKKNDGTAFNFYYLEVYGLEIYESGVLTHNFVPKVVNGVAGLYDTETGNFVSSGTSTPLVAIYAQNNS